MLAVTTSFAIPDFNSCSVTATPPLDRPRTTLTSVFTGPGVRAANPAIRRVPHSTTLLRRAFRATHRASVVAEGSSVEHLNPRRYTAWSCRIRRHGLSEIGRAHV